MKRICFLVIVSLLIGAVLLVRPYVEPLLAPLKQRMGGAKTVADRLHEFGDAARQRMQSGFESAGVDYPPAAVTLLAVKSKRVLTVYAGRSQDTLTRVLEYPVLGQRGELGPKLREGDRQVPEGRYQIEGLNPNSRFHVSLRVDYPNAFDREKAKLEGRDRPGGDIFIHGHTASIGCLAMGDPAAEELFTLAADVGLGDVRLIITPVDFRDEHNRNALPLEPPWLAELYASLETELSTLPRD